MNVKAKALARHPSVRNFRNTGMIWAFEVRSDDAVIGRRIYEAALAREILLRPIGATVYFMPPYTMTDDEQSLLVERTLDVVKLIS
jgi:adenosylmethionine-8-amino-7-oxononanoate aminotransferase